MSKLANSLPHNKGPAAHALEAADPKVQLSRVPKFGTWDNEDNDGYVVNVEYKEKTKKVESMNEPQMSQLMLPPAHPQAHPLLAKPEPPQHEVQLQVPQFDGWEGEAIVGYNESFDNVRKLDREERGFVNMARISSLDKDLFTEESRPLAKTTDKQQQKVYGGGRRSTVEHMGSKEGCSKGPHFGAWEEGENGAYTAYFKNARKMKNVGPMLDSVEPQLNRDVNDRAWPSAAVGTKYKIDDKHHLRNASRGFNSSVATLDSAMRHGRQNAGGQSPIHQKAGTLQLKPPAGRGSQTPDRGAAIPAWGVWNTDPSQAEDFTGVFTRAKEERNTPLGRNGTPFNMARCPLGDLEIITERSLRPARPDEELAYGGGNRLRFWKKDGKIDGQSKSSALRFPASVAESESVQKGSKLRQLSEGVTISQFGGKCASITLDNDTPAFYHCPTHCPNQRGKPILSQKGCCFPWFYKDDI